MPGTETIMINGTPVVIEKIITSGDLLIAMMLTVSLSVLAAGLVILFMGGKK